MTCGKKLSEEDILNKLLNTNFELIGNYKKSNTKCLFKCKICNNIKEIIPQKIFSGHTKTCGCRGNFSLEEKRKKARINARNHYKKNIILNKLKHKEYFDKNKDKIYIYRKLKRKNDINFKLSCNLRVRLNRAIKEDWKSGSAVKDLGCSIEKFKLWIEMHWQNGMNWNNYGKNGWHIDHTKPMASFDLSNREQLLVACHFTNLRPMWAKDNISKSDKLI